MTKFLKNLFAILLFFSLEKSLAFAASTSIIDLQKLTCGQWVEYNKPNEPNNITDELRITTWITGKLETDNLFAEARAFDVYITTDQYCKQYPSANLLKVFRDNYANSFKIYPEEEGDVFDLKKTSCKDLEIKDGKLSQNGHFWLALYSGRLSKTDVIDFNKLQEISEIVLTKCQQQPTALLLPIIKDLINSR